MAGPASRVKTHSEGITLISFDSKRRLVTCGGDADVKTYLNFPEELEGPEEFDLSTSSVSAMVCYVTKEGKDIIALATDANNVVTFTVDGTANKLLTRFTSPITSLAVTKDHTLLAAGSSEFTIKVLELHKHPSSFMLVDHEAPVLCVDFDPNGEFLASSCCDGTVRVWSMTERDCIHKLNILAKCSEVSSAPSLCKLAWGNAGKFLAVPVGSKVNVYAPPSWRCAFTLSDTNYHSEAINVVKFSPCGQWLACGDVSGCVSIWNIPSRTCKLKMRNENQTGITALEWDLRGADSPEGNRLLFADSAGYVGVFEGVYPPNKDLEPPATTTTSTGQLDPLAEDSLLMEGIPADDIFGDLDDMDLIGSTSGDNVGVASPERAGPTAKSRKRVRLDSEGETFDADPVAGEDTHSNQSGGPEDGYYGDERGRSPLEEQPRAVGSKFSEKQVEEYQLPWQPSATPKFLQHRFMVYNLVGTVRCNDNESMPLIEVDFHNSGTHHSFSLPNPLSHSMAALSEEALVLACEREEDQTSQLQCVHFNSWDTNKDWTIPMPGKESITAVTIGNGWIAIATSKQLLRLFTIGGVQREVISIPGHVTTLAGWGPRLSIVYQVPPCTSGVYSLTVWTLDVQRKKQLHPPHTLPISRHSQLRWIGFSEEGCLLTHDSKGMVRIHGNSCYGGSSWIPVLETNKQLGSKSDHYVIVGMTHNPDELRCILCKDSEYPPVHPRPVMCTLPLNVPLCEPQLERTEHERDYIQASLVTPPTQHRLPAELVQRLMKMFALSCKSGKEYKAWEIAAMMPDQQSVDLAMTYASRSQHFKLARQINELSQQKFNHASDSDLSDNEMDGEWTNQNTDDHQGEELSYARTRKSSLQKGPSFSRPAPLSNGIRIKGRVSQREAIGARSKFSQREVEAGRRGNPPQRNTHSSKKERESLTPPQDDLPNSGANETAELFSDTERDTPPVEDDDAESAVLDNESENGDAGLDVGGGAGHTPKAFGDESVRKRANPFKLTTPVSKRLSAERRLGFLDNITARVNEDTREREERNQKRRGSAIGGVARDKGGKGTKKKNGTAPQMQKSLKKSFFKNKSTPADKTPTPDPPSLTSDPAADDKTPEQSQNHTSNGDTSTSCDQASESHDHDQGSHDLEQESYDHEQESHDHDKHVSNGVSGGQEEKEEEEKMEEGELEGVEENSNKAAKLTSAEKLASFAFKATS